MKPITCRTARFLLGNSIVRKLLLVGAALVVTLPAGAAVRYVGGGFGFGPAFGGWGYGYPPYYGGAYSVVVTHPGAGEVKLDTKIKDADVFVNGAYAGTAKELKTMWMRQGAYNFEVRSPGRPTFAEKIYVVTGKTVHVRPGFGAEPKS